MTLAKLLPRSIRLANYYVKAKKIASRKEYDNELKLKLIEKIENNRGGEKYFLADVKPSMLGVIGKKDINKILISIEAYEKAIRYLNSAKQDLDTVSTYPAKQTRIIDNTIFISFYLAKANAMISKATEAEHFFENASIYITRIIEEDPSNTRATELYEWFIVKETFNIMASAQKRYPDMQAEFFSATKRLYENYDTRDKGNEHINKVLGRLS